MLLGIVVVYVVREEHAGLLDLHLEQIEKNTGVPYTIYGCAVRLGPDLLEKLRSHPRVRLIDCPPTNLADGMEHAYYLDALTQVAVDDGVTHVVTLHVDSFPVRPGWIEELLSRLGLECPLATITRISTACLLFTREFHLEHRPRYRVPEPDQAHVEFRRFLRKHRPAVHSGTGYAFAAYRAGLSWYELQDSTRAGILEAHGRVYDDLVYHLGGAVRVGRYASSQSRLIGRRSAKCLRVITGVLQAMPRWTRQWLPEACRQVGRHLDEAQRYALMDHACRELLSDPEGMLHRLCGRERQVRRQRSEG